MLDLLAPSPAAFIAVALLIGLVIGSLPQRPDLIAMSNRAALARLGPVRAALPAGAGSMDAADFAAMSAAAFDRDWVTTLVR